MPIRDKGQTQNSIKFQQIAMGLNLKDLVVREKTTLEAFATKVIAIDAYNAIADFHTIYIVLWNLLFRDGFSPEFKSWIKRRVYE